MSQILWQYNKTFGSINIGIIVETVNRFTNLGNYAKGLVTVNGKEVLTLWYGSKDECIKRIDEHKIVCKFFNMTDPSFLSPSQIQYILDQDGEYDRFSRLVRFQNQSWIKKFVLEDHYYNRYSYSGSSLVASHPEQFCDFDGILGSTRNQDYILRETEISNNANILRVNYAIFQQPELSKSFTLSPYFYKCVKVAFLLNVLFNIIHYKKYTYIFTLPKEMNAMISWEIKQFINEYFLYPTQV